MFGKLLKLFSINEWPVKTLITSKEEYQITKEEWQYVPRKLMKKHITLLSADLMGILLSENISVSINNMYTQSWKSFAARGKNRWT